MSRKLAHNRNYINIYFDYRAVFTFACISDVECSTVLCNSSSALDLTEVNDDVLLLAGGSVRQWKAAAWKGNMLCQVIPSLI